MGKSKNQSFSDAQITVAKIAKGLSHPARIAILEYLLTKDSCVCGDIVNELPLAQATVSQHLKELKELGLIKGEISGTKVCYCINQPNWTTYKTILATFFDYNSNIANVCC